ncbi:MAG: hypothetical protein Q9226_000233 [Calogaya cf. arnoldii]
MIAIGGGGYVPARILRSFLKRPAAPNIPIQAIGLSLYEQLPSSNPSNPVEAPGTKVTRTQWLDLSSLEMANLVGKNILIVDEVDDTRTTLEYAVKELQKDVQTAADKLGTEEKTQFSIFVLHVSLLLGRHDTLQGASELGHFFTPFTLLTLRNATSEQGQDEEGSPAARYDGRWTVLGGQDSIGRVDMLSLGGYVYSHCFRSSS